MVVSGEFPQPDSVNVRSVSKMRVRNNGVFFVFGMLCLLSLYLDVKTRMQIEIYIRVLKYY